VRERRVATADRLDAVHDMAESRLLRDLLQLRARVGDRNEALWRLLLADHFRHMLEEVLLEDVRLERRAGFARDDEERGREVDLALQRLQLGRVGRVEDSELRESVLLS